MKKRSLTIFTIVLLVVASAMPLLASAKEEEAQLTIIELKAYGKPDRNPIPTEDNADTNPDYALLRYHWYSTASYYVNPSNPYGFTVDEVTGVVQTAAETWDIKTQAEVFAYVDTTELMPGTGDGHNVVAFGNYKVGVIAVAYLWSVGKQIVETDLRLNSYYAWSLSGEANKMDCQNLLTHEFGHWAGLKDLYNNADYWLTMYGYGDYGETYKQNLGMGDIKGLQAFYGT